ncbi:heavy metal-associated domain-containing protein [Campylobacter sp. 9BO]|uniref:heavy-metal-associated domain-containing protein n=1 Tax=Campylobacter sp. 9BO TaxID=3424759 RepID=UPI003D3373F4
MKKFTLLTIMSSFLFAEQIHQLNIPNMGCEHCVKQIENAVINMPGYKSMSFDLQTKDVNITTDKNTSLSQVIKAIKSSKEKKFKVGIK